MKNSIGSNIKYYRKQLGLTQEELAGQLFVTSQAVSKWESDAGLPDTAQIVPLAKVLNISTDALFGLEQGNYDAVPAAKVHVKFRELRSQIDKKKGALEACEYLLSECEANPLNFEIYMYFVQSVANLSRNIDPFSEYKKGMNETYDKYFDEALKMALKHSLRLSTIILNSCACPSTRSLYIPQKHISGTSLNWQPAIANGL